MSQNRKSDDTGKRYDEMTPSEKRVFIFKLALCILTFGFAFPNVMNE